ncbi:MAG: T9SS type A sorting domain-containing protein, partial [Muribaculaceae bacterium]|nr:T9SS type A sorting domain-containing protein [Muribaculaceae bacterium]
DGFGVYNSDNNKIGSIDFPSGYERDWDDYDKQAFMAIGKRLYFIVGGLTKKGYDDDEECTAIYSIESNPGSVSLVSVAPTAKISPRTPRKGENVCVSIDSELVGKDCLLNVVSSSGQTVLEARIPEGENQFYINTSKFSKGVYVVSVSSEGVSKETAKIIIR